MKKALNLVGCFFWFEISRANLAFRYYLVYPLEPRLKPTVFLLPRDHGGLGRCNLLVKQG